jgi:Spy/CpxP family protein refolding chaperone
MSGQKKANRIQRLAAALPVFIFVCAFTPVADGDSAEEARAAAHAAEAAREGIGIPALSEGQIAAYLDGRAMWMASVAELNRYPGPRQVLELADELELTAEQQQAIINLDKEMRPQAIRLGKQLIAQEQRLNRLFAWGQASAENIKATVTDIGVIQAKLRYTHLRAHIRAKGLLTSEQVKRYDELQGQATPNGEGGNKAGCNAAHHHGR